MLKVRRQLVSRTQVILICGLVLILTIFVTFYDHPKTKYILNTTKIKLNSIFSMPSDYTRLGNMNFTFKMLPLVCNGTEDLLVLVHSSTDHFNNRKVIRETWGQQYKDVRLLFVLGAVENSTIQDELYEENKLHNDILQGDFLDTYHNLTYKHIMALKYMVYHCPSVQFVLKVDDDVFVNIPSLKLFITLYVCQNGQPIKIMCSRIRTPPVLRSGKWATSLEEYPGKNYPTHCGGFAILYPRSVVSILYAEAQKTKFFWVDDVFVSGICAKNSNIGHIGIENLVLSDRDVHNIVDLSFTNITKPFLIGRINLNEAQIRSLWKFVSSNPPKTMLDFLRFD